MCRLRTRGVEPRGCSITNRNWIFAHSPRPPDSVQTALSEFFLFLPGWLCAFLMPQTPCMIQSKVDSISEEIKDETESILFWSQTLISTTSRRIRFAFFFHVFRSPPPTPLSLGSCITFRSVDEVDAEEVQDQAANNIVGECSGSPRQSWSLWAIHVVAEYCTSRVTRKGNLLCSPRWFGCAGTLSKVTMH